MSIRAKHRCGSCGTSWGQCKARRVTGLVCHPVPIEPDLNPMHTESNVEGIEQVHPARAIGEIPLRDYLAMAAPGAILIQKREVSWMLFVVFLAGGIVGMLLGKLLA